MTHATSEPFRAHRTSGAPRSPRVEQVCRAFGIAPDAHVEAPATVGDIPTRPGAITFVSGPSGSGKTRLVGRLAIATPGSICVGGVHDGRASVIDHAAAAGCPHRAMRTLTACGLGEPRLWLRRADQLSAGERFRAELAIALCDAQRRDGPALVLCDEFLTGLHARLATCVAFNVRKLIAQSQIAFIAASANDEITRILSPDWQVTLHGSPCPSVRALAPYAAAPAAERARMAILGTAVIERGRLADYRAMAAMHYRCADAIAFIDSVFVLRERPGGAAIGVAVFAHGPNELAGRNIATKRRYVGRPALLNAEVRILRRLIMHADVRGCGFGHWFVRRILPYIGVRIVECLAAMGTVNPIFEKAGMTHVPVDIAPHGRIQLLRRMADFSLDPFAPSFLERIAGCPRVRDFISDTVRDWMRATRGVRGADPCRRSNESLAASFRQILAAPPRYYLWDRENEFPSTKSL